jgi:hypothetical protein
MLMVPATNSDSPPKMTTRGRPSADSPAVTANGTVSPSEKPIVKLEIRCARKLAEVGDEESSSVVAREEGEGGGFSTVSEARSLSSPSMLDRPNVEG